MHLSHIAYLLLASSSNVAAKPKPNKHSKVDRSWAGVNSFFLHAFPQYAITHIELRRAN